MVDSVSYDPTGVLIEQSEGKIPVHLSVSKMTNSSMVSTAIINEQMNTLGLKLIMFNF